MRKSLSNLKMTSNPKATFHEFTKSEMQNSVHPSQQISQRRKQSLTFSSRNQSALMAQIKQALKTKQTLVPQKMQRLNDNKKALYEDMDPSSKYYKKQNKAYNAQERQITFKDNLKQMQVEISSLKKLMQYQKARNHKIFQQKLFTVEQKFQEHKNIDDKIIELKKFIEQSNKTMIKERKLYLQQAQKYKFIKRQELNSLKQQIDCFRDNYVTIEDVDQRIAENLQIFKTFLIQNIDKDILTIIDNKTIELTKTFQQVIQQTKQQGTEFHCELQKSHQSLFEQMQALRDECQSIAESVAREQVMKFQDNFDEISTQITNKISSQTSKLRQQWIQNMDHYQRRISQLQNEIPNFSIEIGSRISKRQQQTQQIVFLFNDIIPMFKNLIQKIDSIKTINIDPSVSNIILSNTKQIQYLKQEIQNINQQFKAHGSRLSQLPLQSMEFHTVKNYKISEDNNFQQ